MTCTIVEHQSSVVVTPDDCGGTPIVVLASDSTSVVVGSEPPEQIVITQGARGLPGFDVELQKTATHVQWRLRKDGAPWQDLVPLSELIGPTSTKAGGILFATADPGPDWVLCDGSLYTGGGPLAAALASSGGYLPDFTGAQVPAYISKVADTSEVWARMADLAAHTAAADPHPQYTTAPELSAALTSKQPTATLTADVAAGIHAATAKATPVDADEFGFLDSAASWARKKLTWANIVAKLRGTFVEGPASSVDGQVMVFDGASGKKAKSGGALGNAAFANQADFSIFNILKDNGRFDSSAGFSIDVNPANFTVGFLFRGLYGGTTISNAGRFIHNNSDFGGVAGNMTQTTLDLLAAMGRSGVYARYGFGFLILELLIGGGVVADNIVSGESFGVVCSSSPIACGVNGKLTAGFWIRALDKNCALFGSSLKKSDGAVVGTHRITPAEGWVYRINHANASIGYLTQAIPLYGQPGGRVQIALPVVTYGNVLFQANSPIPNASITY